MNTSVLFVPSCSERVAATRLRVAQYVPLLERQGVRCTVFPAVSDGCTRLMLASPSLKGGRRLAYYARLLAERFARFWAVLWLAARHRLVFLQRATFPFGLHRLLTFANANIIFDFDDSIYMADPEDGHPGFLRRVKNAVKSAEVSGVLRRSRAAVVENEFLKTYAQRYCPRVAVIPGPIDTERFARRAPHAGRAKVIGWIGSPSTSSYLALLAAPLAKLARRHDLTVKLIGIDAYDFPGVRTLCRPWRLETEVAELQSLDIGLMPMIDNDWTRGKLGVKMLQYMAVGVPAAVSFTPTNAEVIDDGANGFLIMRENDWTERLTRLIEDAALRERFAETGRATIVERYSLSAGAPKLAALIDEISERHE